MRVMPIMRGRHFTLLVHPLHLIHFGCILPVMRSMHGVRPVHVVGALVHFLRQRG
jgi:hypothetical protein